MATVQCSKCTAERKGFRRELDSWRYKLIHCVGFESILEGIYGSMLMRDLNLFEDCEPKEVDDWSPDAGFAQCSFCNLPLDKLSDQVPAATSPLSSPSEYSPCQAPTISESGQTAHKFLQAVFHRKDVSLGCDSNIPLIAQELMKKMIHQFAMEYASKCLLHTSTNGATTRTLPPLSETSDVPLDLTVSRVQGEKEKEPEPDGVLDLSNRNSTCSATSSSSSSNGKASGCLLPSDIEELEQRHKCHQNSALEAVLRSLCPAHCSLLYQMLKLAHQEQLLSCCDHRPVGRTETHCCRCGVHPQDNVTPLPVGFCECKVHDGSSFYCLNDCVQQGHGSATYHPEDSKSNCSIHHYPLDDCKSEASLGSSYCCTQRCRMETYTVVCPKRVHLISCRSLAMDHISNIVCSFASTSASKSPSLCTPTSALSPSSLIYCKHHNPQRYPCYSNHACLTQVKNPIEKGVGDRDPPCPVLKREHSPSPPPLSPIPSDITKIMDEKPPSLLHHRQEQADLMIKDCLTNANHEGADVDTTTKEEPECRTPSRSPSEQNPSGTLLQEVVSRFSEKLDTIRPLEKDTPLSPLGIHVSGKEQVQSPSTNQNLQFHADAHLTEIITTVLHTGSANDYNLSELFNHHDSKEPKSPNTRSRRRQEVLAAMATPADDASTRRHTLQIKRELAMFDQSYNRRKVPPAKRARLKDGCNGTLTTSSTSSDSSPAKEQSKIESGAENRRVGEGPLSMLSTGSDRADVKEEIQTVIVTEEVQIIKAEQKEMEISNEEQTVTLSGNEMPISKLQSKNWSQCSKDDSLQPQVITATQCGSLPKEDDMFSNDGVYLENDPSGQSSENGRRCNRPVKDWHSTSIKSQKCPFNHSKESRRSRRNIVPPQRFSSYVTEPRKMFFVACFSESIFNQSTRQDKVSLSTTLDALSESPDSKDIHLELRDEAPLSSSQPTGDNSLTQREECGQSNTESKDQNPQHMASKDESKKHGLENEKGDSKCPAKTLARLRSSPKILQVSKETSRMPPNSSDIDVAIRSPVLVENSATSPVQYTSPIKLMFVSPVKDKEGVKYSLKSAASGTSAHTQEHFDPCEESSWSGTPEKTKSQTTEQATHRVKSSLSPLHHHKSPTSIARSACSSSKPGSTPAKSPPSPPKSSSPAKSASSPAKSASSPAKSPSSPPKLSSPVKSASSPKVVSTSTKTGSRKSGEGTPTKRVAGTECQRSQGDLLLFNETTPKRRPGRPKKLGPHLEQKVKRPIGRPRKQKAVDAVIGVKAVNGESVVATDTEENVNKNLKITVVYGRSRRNKRMVSEGFDQLQTEFHDAWHAVGLKHNLGILTQNPKISSGGIKTASTALTEELRFVSPAKESVPQSSSNIKCQKRDDAVPSRKPGRPAKVKISGISVTVTTVSPKQRKIQINKDFRQPLEAQFRKKTLLPEFRSPKEAQTISLQSTSRRAQPEEGVEPQAEGENTHRPDQPAAVRHSKRVRKPSIYFLHAVATSTSRSYSHSNALLRRSKQLLLNKVSNERKLEEQIRVGKSGEKQQSCGQERGIISQDLSRMAMVSVDSIFTPRETLRWWAASAEEKTLNKELARRIRLISDTWVSDTVENQDAIALKPKKGSEMNNSFTKKSKNSSVVRTLFDCSPNKPRSCTMQQLSSWFMQTTETQSLAVVKKASSRNPHEVVHFPRSVNKESVSQSPQAERLRKHIKKFAKTVPKSPFEHKQAQKRVMKKNKASLSVRSVRRELFTAGFARGGLNQRRDCWRRREFGKYQATLCRARTRFLTHKERERWQKRERKKKNLKVATSHSNGYVVTRQKPKRKSLRISVKDQLSQCLDNTFATSSADPTQRRVDVAKEQKLCSKAWSPETLKGCRVFLRKINSPNNESAEEEWDSCTVTLDDGSPPAYLFAGRARDVGGVVKAVKRKGSVNRRTASTELICTSVQKQGETPSGRPKGKCKSPGVVSAEPPEQQPPPPPPAKMLRQSRMRGLTGPRWCDFVFGS